MMGIARCAGMWKRTVVAAGVVCLLALASAMIFVAAPAWAEGSLETGTPALVAQDATYTLTYDYTDDGDTHTATVTGFVGEASGDLVIPEKVEREGDEYAGIEYTVTAVGSNAFKNQTGFSGTLTIPGTVTSIGVGAFEGCSELTGGLNLPENLTSIGASAFKDCEELSGDLSLPSGLVSLGSSAFQDCENLTGTLVIPAGITSIPEKCFYNSSYSHSGSWEGITGIAFAGESQLTTIDAYAFAGNSHVRDGITLPSTVKTVGDYAFYDTGTQSVTDYWAGSTTYYYGEEGQLVLPTGIESIGTYAFANCNFSDGLIIPNATVAIGSYAFADSGFFGGALTLPEGMTEIPDYCFAWDAFTGRLELPSTLTTIDEGAFMRCESFDTTLVIPEGVTSIGDNAFGLFASASNYYNGTLTLPNTLKTIGSSAFSQADSFTGPLVIPDSVESIGENAFNGCRYFTSLELPDNPNFTTIADGTFGSVWGYQMNFMGELVIPSSVTTIGEEAFEYCGRFTGQLVLPSGVTSVGERAFQHCSGFTGALDLPSGLVTIDDGAFLWCSGLTGLSIPNTVTSIGEDAFFGCEAVSGDLVIPGSVKTIGEDAFGQFGMEAEQPGGLVISEGVESIGDDAFKNCDKLTGTVVVPSSVTTLGEGVFRYCEGFTAYSLPDSLTSVPSDLFAGCTGLTGALVIPASAKTIGSRAFANCVGLTGALAVPEGVTSIGHDAFIDCSGLDGELTLPSTLTSIEYEAFFGCKNLSGSLSLPDGLTMLGNSAFEGCAGLTGDVTIPSGVTKLYDNLFKDCAGLTGTLTVPTGAILAYSYVVPFHNTYFSTVVNNSSLAFSGPDMVPSDVVDYYVAQGSDGIAYTLSTGTYKRRTHASTVDISGAEVSDIPDYTFAWTSFYPEPTVTLNGKVLEKDAHYKLSYYGNYYVGTGKVIINGFAYNGYVGQVEKPFNIVSASTGTSISTASIEPIPQQTYTGKAITPALSVKVGGKTLTQGTHYTVSYKNNTNAGTATVTITGVQSAGYTGTATTTFTIKPKAVTPTVTLSKSSLVYNGKVQKPAVTVKVGSTKLAASSYTLAWASGCKAVGAYKVTVKLKGNYAGTKAVTFKIVPKGTSLVSVAAASKGFTAKWKKQATQTTGYKVQYALNSKFTSGVKTVTVKGPKVLSKKVAKLKAKKKYYVRVCTYKTVSGKTYQSAWSKAKAVTTKP